jgi:hypothetical protein
MTKFRKILLAVAITMAAVVTVPVGVAYATGGTGNPGSESGLDHLFCVD